MPEEIQELIDLIHNKKDELEKIPVIFLVKRNKLKKEINALIVELNELKTYYNIPNLSMSFIKLISLKDSYPKLKVLEKKINNYNGLKTISSYIKAIEELKRLKKIESELFIKYKRDSKNQWIGIKIIPYETITIELSDLDIIISDMYKSYNNKKLFYKKCKTVKHILTNVLPYIKNKKVYNKYYSVYIDVCEYLNNNFSIIDYSNLTKRLNKINFSNWLDDVKSKTEIPVGTFTNKAETIVKTLKKITNKNKTKMLRMITFYLNRNSKCKNKGEIIKAKEIIKNMRG